jgi:pimeloyl-ACP methyl ester carboxylesterase
MTTDFTALLSVDVGDLDAAVKSWRKLADYGKQSQERHRNKVTGALRGAGWAGESADAAFPALDAEEAQLGAVQIEAVSIATVLENLSSQLVTARSNLRNAVSDAEADRCTVTDDGIVQQPTPDQADRHDPDYMQWAAGHYGTYQERIDGALHTARQADDQAVRQLRRFIPADFDKPGGIQDAVNDARALAISMCKTPVPEGMTPKEAAKWWGSMNPTDQQMYLAAYPDKVGALDGIPTTIRDEANRTMLDSGIAKLQGQNNPSDADRSTLISLTALRNRMDSNDDGDKAHRIYLIGLDPTDDGKAIVSIGNPDTAKNTAVFVPGTGSDLAGAGGNINRAENMVKASEKYGAPGDTAAVMWLNYDAPDEIPNAAEQGYATKGGPVLSEYVDGLRTTHTADDEHLTVVGHSYGSTLVGAAASKGEGLAADDIIVAGSPGMLVPHASDLSVPTGHVWAAEADGDPVPELGQTTLAGSEYRGWGAWDVNTPTDEAFGANRITTDTHGHSDYWQPDTESLNNQAKIITGHGDQAQLVWKANK